jgi:hypothetical protein
MQEVTNYIGHKKLNLQGVLLFNVRVFGVVLGTDAVG